MWGTGFCGAYTTFSTFGYETLGLIGRQRYASAALYVVSSVLVGVFRLGRGLVTHNQLFLIFLQK